MATRTWLGRAGVNAQTTTITVGGTAAAANVYNVTMNLKTVSYTATGTDTNSTIATALQALLSATLNPEFQQESYSVSSNVITMTASNPGTPYVVSQSVTGTGTLSLSTTVANTSPNDLSNATNWSSATSPVNGDSIVFQQSSVDAIYALETAFTSNTFAALTVYPDFTGQIAQAIYNPLGYYEYQGTTFTCAQITALTIGLSNQATPASFKFSTGTTACTLTVTGSNGGQSSGSEAVWWKGANNTNVVNCYGGSVLVAPLVGDAATILTLNVQDGTVTCTSGVTFATSNVITQLGGTVDVTSNVATWTLDNSATAIVRGTATVTTLTANNGSNTILYSSTGTITNLTLGATDTIDFSGTLGALTVTNCTIAQGATIIDSGLRVVYTNGIKVTPSSFNT